MGFLLKKNQPQTDLINHLCIQMSDSAVQRCVESSSKSTIKSSAQGKICLPSVAVEVCPCWKLYPFSHVPYSYLITVRKLAGVRSSMCSWNAAILVFNPRRLLSHTPRHERGHKQHEEDQSIIKHIIA